MAFNIWRSGTLDGAPGGAENLDQLIGFLRAQDPDILFMVETYGSGGTIVSGLNAGVPNDRQYTGVQLTREPDTVPGTDNLWLFTRLDIEQVYPEMRSGELTSFNFGGVKLRLPSGRTLHAFTVWLHWLGNAFTTTSQTVAELQNGRPRTLSNEQILATEDEHRLAQARTLLDEMLPGYLGDDTTSPVLLGGDLNTQSHLDWSAEFANAPGHAGLVLDWPVTKAFTEAGFVDTFRRSPGRRRRAGPDLEPAGGLRSRAGPDRLHPGQGSGHRGRRLPRAHRTPARAPGDTARQGVGVLLRPRCRRHRPALHLIPLPGRLGVVPAADRPEQELACAACPITRCPPPTRSWSPPRPRRSKPRCTH
jgi:hypothetical protein